MSFADANRASIRVIEEATWGSTPASGKSREIRLTSSALGATKETTTSEEIRSDRMVADDSEVSASSAGDINFEFSAGAQDEFLAAFLMGAWSRPMSRDVWKGTALAVDSSSSFTVSGADLTPYLDAGKRIKTTGFANSANNGYFEIDSVSHSGDVTTITVTGSNLVTENDTRTAKLFDANDVIIHDDTSIEATATGFEGGASVFNSAISAGQLVKGQKIYVEGLGGASGVYTIMAVTGSSIRTNPAPRAIVASGDSVTIKGSMVRNPANVEEIVQRMFTIETAYNDIGQYMIQDGMVPGTFSMEVSAGSIITGTVGFQGRETRMEQSSVLGKAPYDVLDSVSGEVANATTNVGALSKGGEAFDAAVQSISISGEGNLRQQTAIGSKFARGVGAGRLNITGSMSVYFEDGELFNDFLNHTTISLSWAVTDNDGQMYVFTLPAIKLSQDQIAPGGIDQDVMETIEFTAIRDPNTKCMLQIDRFSPAN